jgi:mono/diheme cytochrome c family protein
MKTVLFVLLFIPAIAFSAPLKEKYTNLPAPISIEKGKKLYQANGCPVCHGDQGRGDGPLADGLDNKPRNFKDYEEMKRMPTIRMEQAIHNGLKGTAMPAFSHFSDSEIEVLTSYLRSFLVDSYTDLKMCAFQTYHINAKNLRKPFHVEVDEPEKFTAKVSGKTISFSGKNWPNLLDRKSHRTQFRVMQDEHIVSLISVKISRCQKEMNEMMRSIPLKKARLN